MDSIQFIMTKLGEECGEIIQLASKTALYGIDSAHPETGEVNLEALVRELNDLQAVVELLKAEVNNPERFAMLHNAEALEVTRRKILKWAEPAIKMGNVTPTPPASEPEA